MTKSITGTKSTSSASSYDEIFSDAGEMGLYQWCIFLSIFLFAIYSSDAIQMVFIGGDMDHWCRVEELQGLPVDVQKKLSIPVMTSVVDGGSVEYSKCEMYASNYSYLLLYNDTELSLNDTRSIESCTQGWNYDTSTFQSTIVSRFNLVCGWSFLNQLASSMFMVGALIGGAISGVVSDRYGRKKVMMVFSCLKIIGYLLSIFGTNYAVFIVGRFIIGVGCAAFYITAYVFAMEAIGPRYRSRVGSALMIASSVGFMLQPAMGYFLRDDFSYQILATSPNLAFPLIIALLFVESPRWLAANERFEETLQVLKRISEFNRTALPPDFNHITDVTTAANTKKAAAAKPSRLFSLSSPVLRRRAVIMYFNWFTWSLVYYALSLNTGTLNGNIYINTFLSGAVEVPAYLLGVLLMDSRRLGRRWTGFLMLSAAALSNFLCIPASFVNQDAATVFSMFGKAFICIAVSVCYIVTAELFPTQVRNVELGNGHTWSRISSIAAPYVGGPLGDFWKPLPSLLFGVFASLSGLSYILLPETLGQPLFDTVDELQRFIDTKQHSGIKSLEIAVDRNTSNSTKDSATLYCEDRTVENDGTIFRDTLLTPNIDDLVDDVDDD